MNLDESFFRLVNGLAGQGPWLDGVMLALGRPDTLVVPVLLAAAWWLWRRPREAVVGAAALALVIVVADAIGAQLKHLVARPRPCQLLQQVHDLAGCGKMPGFPSNHALNTAAAAAFLQILYPWTAWISWPLVVVIGLARVYLGAHYGTDVLGGWIMGGLIGAGAGLVLVRWKNFRAASDGVAAKEPAGTS
jgi:undecaprenyl-diphosphatase